MKKLMVGMVVLTLAMTSLAACGQAGKTADTTAAVEQETTSVAGTYSRTFTEEMDGSEMEFTETVVLKDDNTCEVSFQDTIPGTWTEDKITLDDGSSFEYNVEGDTLNLNMNGEWVSFSK